MRDYGTFMVDFLEADEFIVVADLDSPSALVYKDCASPHHALRKRLKNLGNPEVDGPDITWLVIGADGCWKFNVALIPPSEPKFDITEVS